MQAFEKLACLVYTIAAIYILELEIYTSCNDTTDGVSRLYSPYYPGHYYNNARCTWEIIANTGYNIRLQFEYFSTEKNFDGLLIYDGPIYDQVLRKVLTGTYANLLDIDSYSNRMFLNFTSSYIGNNYRGFAIHVLAFDGKRCHDTIFDIFPYQV